MRTLCTVATVRSAEAGAGVAEPVLMQRAATALAGICVELLQLGRGSVRGARVVALVGSGNNGGDALWALAFLARRGVAATAIGEPVRMHPEGAAAARAAGARLVDWSDAEADAACSAADLALDGIVGIGGSGGLREPAAAAVAALAAAGVPMVAVDVPSGVDSDTGEVADPAVTADVTACFGVLKPGLLLAPGRAHAGSVTVVDIGLRPANLEPAALALELADLTHEPPDAGTHKYRRGVVGVTAGSHDYPGAALLAVGGARQAEAGFVTFAPGSGGHGATDPLASLVVDHYPDVVVAAGARDPDARCIGPGLGSGASAVGLVLDALDEAVPLVVDASGLDVLAGVEGRAALAARAAAGRITVLTPHAGEFARMGLSAQGGPLAAARRAADHLGCVVVLKGPGTVVAVPGGPAYVDTFGSAALATAGTGDVLAGLMAGMLAAAAASASAAAAEASPASERAAAPGLTLADAALVAARAVGRHGLAGRLAASDGGNVTAADVLAALPAAMAAVTAQP